MFSASQSAVPEIPNTMALWKIQVKVGDMRIKNVHERKVSAPFQKIGKMIDTVSSEADQVWPHENWPRMELNQPLGIDASGGHGPIQYKVTAYEPGRHIRFAFMKHFDGYHEIVLESLDDNCCLLRHNLIASVQGMNVPKWWFVIRPLHNALVEDLFDKVERNVNCTPRPRSWGFWATWLHRLLRRRKKL